MFRKSGHLALKPLAWASITLLLVACTTDAIVDVANETNNRTIVASVGQEVHITLGNVGPATYESPPQISSSAVVYLGVDVVPPYTPAGPNQQFQFRAAHKGDAVIVFRRLLGESLVSVVEDTVHVR